MCASCCDSQRSAIPINTEVCPNCWNIPCSCVTVTPAMSISEPEFQRPEGVLVPSCALALAEPYKWRVRWSDPWTGINAEGKQVTANVDQYASLQDCIAIARYALHCQTRLCGVAEACTDEMLLDQFCTVHRATIVRAPV